MYDKRDELPLNTAPIERPAYSLAASILRDFELLAQIDKKMVLAVAAEVRKKSREVEDMMLGDDHPHARFFTAHRDDPFLDEIKSMELSDSVPD